MTLPFNVISFLALSNNDLNLIKPKVKRKKKQYTQRTQEKAKHGHQGELSDSRKSGDAAMSEISDERESESAERERSENEREGIN